MFIGTFLMFSSEAWILALNFSSKFISIIDSSTCFIEIDRSNSDFSHPGRSIRDSALHIFELLIWDTAHKRININKVKAILYVLKSGVSSEFTK
jgi:hypothetical protein